MLYICRITSTVDADPMHMMGRKGQLVSKEGLRELGLENEGRERDKHHSKRCGVNEIIYLKCSEVGCFLADVVGGQ